MGNGAALVVAGDARWEDNLLVDVGCSKDILQRGPWRGSEQLPRTRIQDRQS